MWASKLEVLSRKIETLDKTVLQKKTRREMLMEQRLDLEKKISELNILDLDLAATTLKELAQVQRQKASSELAKLGTLGLQYSLGPNYEMEIEISGTAKNPEAYVWIIKDGKTDNKEDPLEDNGGGIIDIVGVALRLVIMDNYDDPMIDGPIIFDEPFKMVSKEYIPMLSEFIANVSKDFNRQIIMVTHNDYLSAMTDTNIYVSLDDDGRSVVK